MARGVAHNSMKNPIGGKEPWQMTREEYISTGTQRAQKEVGQYTLKSNHRQLIVNALSEGKPVPAEVLRDYPDLKGAKMRNLFPQICGNCEAAIYGTITPVFCPKCKMPWKGKNPIRHTNQGWFWGSRGPFPTRGKAVQVMRAVYASGYKGKNPSRKASKTELIGAGFGFFGILAIPALIAFMIWANKKYGEQK